MNTPPTDASPRALTCVDLPALGEVNSTRVSDHLHRHGGSFAAADAERGDPALQIAALERVQQRHQDARARRADGMAERASPAIDVDLGVVEAEIAHGDHGDIGESL